MSGILDTFAGSGATALAGLEHGIKEMYMIERDSAAFKIMHDQLRFFSDIEIVR